MQSVCLLEMTVYLTKMVEQIEVQFGVWTWMGPSNHVLGRTADHMGHPREAASLGREGAGS